MVSRSTILTVKTFGPECVGPQEGLRSPSKLELGCSGQVRSGGVSRLQQGCVDEAGQGEFFTGGTAPGAGEAGRPAQRETLGAEPGIRSTASSSFRSLRAAADDFQTLMFSDRVKLERRRAALSSSGKRASDFRSCEVNEFGGTAWCPWPTALCLRARPERRSHVWCCYHARNAAATATATMVKGRARRREATGRPRPATTVVPPALLMPTLRVVVSGCAQLFPRQSPLEWFKNKPKIIKKKKIKDGL